MAIIPLDAYVCTSIQVGAAGWSASPAGVVADRSSYQSRDGRDEMEWKKPSSKVPIPAVSSVVPHVHLQP